MTELVARANFTDIDGVLWGWRWSANRPDGHTRLAYGFAEAAGDYGYTVNGFAAFNPAERAAAKAALALYDSYCNLDFVEAADAALADIRLGEADSVEIGRTVTVTTGYAFAPDPNFAPPDAEGDAFFNHTDYGDPAPGGAAFAVGILHELGHALGLKHGHVAQTVKGADGALLYANPALAADHDSLEYSVMTYRAFPGADIGTDFARDFPTTPMQDDILALQWAYGPNYAWRAGDTVYSWSPKTGEMFVDGQGEGAPLRNRIFLTVWDGGGNDTYDFGAYRTDAVIDLAPGAWSTPAAAQRADLDMDHPGTHLARGAIANAVLFAGDAHGFIENAIGGAGDDQIAGNAVSNILFGGAGDDAIDGRGGHDVLIGGRGEDALTGGGGADVFRFARLAESRAGRLDWILDFNGRAGDRIDLSGIDANAGRDGDQHFRFIGTAGFHGKAGELRSAGHRLEGDVDGDGRADFAVHLNLAKLGAGELVLG